MLQKLHKLDLALLSRLQELPKSLKPVMIAATIVGQPAVLFAMLVVFVTYAYLAREYLLVKVGVASAILLLISPALKLLFQRGRPDEILFASYKQPSSYSFPSGHAYCTLLVFGLFAYLAYTKLSSPLNIAIPILLTLLVFVIGLSRVYLGAHYPSDVLAGWLLGGIVLVLLIKVSGV